jgi:5-methylcytosine-specific restriction endonuclease McrA
MRDDFPRNASKPDGLGTYCRACNRVVQKEYGDRVAARTKPPVATKVCPKCERVLPASMFFANRRCADGLSCYCKLCQNAAIDAWCERNPERVCKQNREDARRYRERYPERKRAQNKVTWDSNPDRNHANHWARKARKHGAFVERVYRARVWARDKGTCHLCGLPVDPCDWHLDHIVPLSRGGKHCYANVAVAHPYCNVARGARPIEAPWEGCTYGKAG